MELRLMDPREPYHARRIGEEADLLRALQDLGGVTLRKPRKTVGFERRMERADDRPRVDRGEYIGGDWSD